ncbi:MAG: hypothetical protein GC186_14190 [Rhodobacteraceae bacterium]|nr:hypothetical protein [Paracoccaceae bacterium]
MLGRVARREDIRAMLDAIYPRTPVADFMADVLMAEDSPFFTPVRMPEGGWGHFITVAKLAAIEILITETTLARWQTAPEHHGDAREVATARLWSRLCKVRARADDMVRDYNLLHAPPPPTVVPLHRHGTRAALFRAWSAKPTAERRAAVP